MAVRTVAQAGTRRVTRLSPATRRNLRNGLLFISPWLLGLCIFTAYPILATLYYSVTDFDGVDFPPHFVGLTNFQSAADHRSRILARRGQHFVVGASSACPRPSCSAWG